MDKYCYWLQQLGLPCRPQSLRHHLAAVFDPSMNPRTKRLLILVLAFDALVVAGVVLYFMLRR